MLKHFLPIGVNDQKISDVTSLRKRNFWAGSDAQFIRRLLYRLR